MQYRSLLQDIPQDSSYHSRSAGGGRGHRGSSGPLKGIVLQEVSELWYCQARLGGATKAQLGSGELRGGCAR